MTTTSTRGPASGRPDSSELLRWFADIGEEDGPRVGNKGASLGELHRAGTLVPPGFVVTTKAFQRFMEGVDREHSIRTRVASLDAEDLAGVASACWDIRRTIERSPLPDELRSAIAYAYPGLRTNYSALKLEPPVAVRSSITGDTSSEAGATGMPDTFLWVRGVEGVAHAVRACWASLYSAESVTHRLRQKLSESNVGMGVVVQRMVNSQSAGIMFTQSPLTGDRSVIAIEGSWGLGSSVVSGEVTPDRFVVSKATGQIVKRTIAEKQLQHLPDHFGGGVRHEPVPDEEQKLPCLSDAQITELARLATCVERHYGAAQDIEWAFGPDDRKAFLLQSRPARCHSTTDARLMSSTAVAET
jgi:pyruvate,water dikinase